MIELRQFRHIAALARHRNFRMAAESVFISQPALSLSIKAAEESLGQKLFIRSNKSIVPTTYGEIVVDMAEKILNDVENMQREIDLLSEIETGYLKLSFSPFIHHSISEKFIQRFTKEYPAISLNLNYGLWETRIEMLKNKQVDLVVEAFAVDAERKIFREPEIANIDFELPNLKYFCRSGHPLAGQKRVSYKDIVKYDWAGEGGPPQYRYWLVEATGISSTKELLERRIKFFSSDYYAILTAVINSDRISAGSTVFFDKYEKEGLIHYLNVDWKVPFEDFKGNILMLKNRPVSPVLEYAISLIRELMAELIVHKRS